MKEIIPKSVASYEDECTSILSWLSTDKWLDQHEFDRLSFEWRWGSKSQPRKAVFLTPETIMPPLNGDFNIAILQEFQASGIVESRINEGIIEYRLVAA
jgi:hypothetical protein